MLSIFPQFFSSVVHTFSSMSHPSLRSFSATPNIKWKSETTRIGTAGPPPRRPTEDIIYGSRYDADSSINKGLSLLLFQPSQSFQYYLSPFPACAGRIVGAAEKHTCWNSDKILQNTLQTEMRASLTTESQVYWCSFAGTAVSNGDVVYLFLCEKKDCALNGQT